jgi:hypothetical protein
MHTVWLYNCHGANYSATYLSIYVFIRIFIHLVIYKLIQPTFGSVSLSARQSYYCEYYPVRNPTLGPVRTIFLLALRINIYVKNGVNFTQYCSCKCREKHTVFWRINPSVQARPNV